MKPFYRPCWVDVELSALAHNFRQLKRRLAPKTRVLAVVKANGYGHGLIPSARAAINSGAVMLGVSSLEEGVELRHAGIETPVLVLGTLFPFENFRVLFEKKLTPTIASVDAARALSAQCRRRRQKIAIHLKIDTGFGRIGTSVSNAVRFMEQTATLPGLVIEGVFTHFSSSDVDAAYTRGQAQAFWKVIRSVATRGIRPSMVHLANSSAILRFPETHGTLVRPGLALYGAYPYARADKAVQLRPMLTWKTRIIFLKSIPKGFSLSYARTWKASRASRVATLAVGYADGYPRILSNRSDVLIKGRRAPVIGRVTMDMMMVDVTGIPACRVGDEAVLIGAQGGHRIAAEELAQKAQTNVYEILSRIAPRVPRIYHGTN
jgi:alanine racemase